MKSTLYKHTGATTTLFTLTDTNGIKMLDDTTISSITIRRGSTSPDTTAVTPLLEIDHAAARPFSTIYQQVRLNLNLPTHLRAHPAYDPTIIKRFTGNIYVQEEKAKTIIGGRPTSSKKIYAAGTIRRFNTSNSTAQMKPVEEIAAAWSKITRSTQSTNKYFGQTTNFKVLFEEKESWVPFSKILGKLKDAGLFILNDREGTLIAYDLVSRSNYLKKNDTTPVIETYQTLAPADISEANESPLDFTLPEFYTVATPDAAQRVPVLMREMREKGAEVAAVIWPEYQPIDRIIFPNTAEGSHAYRMHTSRLLQKTSNRRIFSSLTVDMLLLLRNVHEDPAYNAASTNLFFKLLQLEEGDPIHLGSSFGPFTETYATTGITETITRDTWQMQLSICPAELITGDPARRRTWNQAPFPWADPTMTDWTS